MKKGNDAMQTTPGTPPMAQENDPLYHAGKMRQSMKDISNHLRDDIDKLHEPQAKALFEVTAEVLDGLVKAFQDYEEKAERAWRA
jgi:hypothetical protein